MIVEFLGQGLQIVEDETFGNHICSAIKDESFTQITIFVAFLRKPNLNYFKTVYKKSKRRKLKIKTFAKTLQN